MSKSPRKTPAPATEARPGRPVTRSARPQPMVLIVDDFQDNREMYAEFLSFAGFQVIEAGNGREALDQAFEHRPDIVLMDLSLPGLDGWEATRQLKGDPRTRSIPVVALTGHALAGHSQGAREAGCDDFVAKPCLPEDLVAKVNQLLAASSAPVGTKGRR